MGVEASVPDSHLVDAVARIVQPQSIASWKRIERGYTPAQRWVARLHNGSSVFVKAATNDMTAGWLRAEHLVYSQLDAGYLPRMLGWYDDGARPALILEDLSQALWPPPWSDSLVKRVMGTLSQVRSTSPPAGLPVLDADVFNGRGQVADHRDPFLSIQLCDAEWLNEALPVLLEAERVAPTAGDQLVHFDVRSDNMCFADGRTMLVDWNLACHANGLLDVAFWLPSLETEGGPIPEQVSPEASLFAAAISGFFAARAGLPVIRDAPRVREVQRAQLKSALPWAVRTLDLPPLKHDRQQLGRD